MCVHAHCHMHNKNHDKDLIILIMDVFFVQYLGSYRRCKQERTWFLPYFSRGIQLCWYFFLKTTLCTSIPHHCVFDDMVQDDKGRSIIAHPWIVWKLIITFFWLNGKTFDDAFIVSGPLHHRRLFPLNFYNRVNFQCY